MGRFGKERKVDFLARYADIGVSPVDRIGSSASNEKAAAAGFLDHQRRRVLPFRCIEYELRQSRGANAVAQAFRAESECHVDGFGIEVIDDEAGHRFGSGRHQNALAGAIEVDAVLLHRECRVRVVESIRLDLFDRSCFGIEGIDESARVAGKDTVPLGIRIRFAGRRLKRRIAEAIERTVAQMKVDAQGALHEVGAGREGRRDVPGEEKGGVAHRSTDAVGLATDVGMAGEHFMVHLEEDLGGIRYNVDADEGKTTSLADGKEEPRQGKNLDIDEVQSCCAPACEVEGDDRALCFRIAQFACLREAFCVAILSSVSFMIWFAEIGFDDGLPGRTQRFIEDHLRFAESLREAVSPRGENRDASILCPIVGIVEAAGLDDAVLPQGAFLSQEGGSVIRDGGDGVGGIRTGAVSVAIAATGVAFGIDIVVPHRGPADEREIGG